MATFRIDTPDGRSFEINGDRAPTEQEVMQMVGNNQPQFSEDALAQVRANNEAYAQRQEENRPWLDKNPIGRLATAGMQGIANATFNPAGYIARAAGMDTKPFKAQNGAERSAELAGQYGYDAAVLTALLKGYAPEAVSGTGLGGNVVRTLADGGYPLALTASTGSALATGMINPQNQYLRMATDMAGGATAGLKAFKPKVNVSSADNQAVKTLNRKFSPESLNSNLAEAERTGRSLLEVGSDDIVNAALESKLKSPEARKILVEKANEFYNAQPQRTQAIINDALGTKGKNESIRSLKQYAQEQAAPLYKEVEEMGDLAPTKEQLAKQNFNKWFEGSQIVDENGQPLKLYHGTDTDFDAFEHGHNRIRPDANGFFLTPRRDMAETYAKGVVDDAKDQYIKEVYLNVKNPYKANNYNEIAKADSKFINQLKKEGYDGIVYKPTEADGVYKPYREEYLAFEPNQIKSVNNSGAWSSSPSLSDAGWNPQTNDALANIVKNNDVIADTIKSVKRSYSSRKNLPDTDARVLLEARKRLSAQTKDLDKTKANEAIDALQEFDPIFNKATGGKIKAANKVYTDEHQFEEAAEIGRDVFNKNISPDDFKYSYDGLSQNEKMAAKLGLKNEIENTIGSAINENVAVKKMLPRNVKEKLLMVAGKENGSKIIDEAEQAVKLNQNLNKLLSGSQTTEKRGLANFAQGVRKFAKNPWDTSVNYIFDTLDRNSTENMANYLTDPNIGNAFRNVAYANQLKSSQIPTRNILMQNLLRSEIENNGGN